MKRIRLSMLLLCLAFLCVSCGGDPAAIPETVAAEQPKTVKVGYFGPLTGLNAATGAAQKQAAELAIEQLNAAGGVLGKNYVLVSYDDRSSPEEAVKVVTKMLTDGVDIIIGSNHGGNILAVGEMIERANIPCIGLSCSSAWMQQGWSYLFRAAVNATFMSESVIRAARSLGAETVIFFHSRDDYGKSVKDEGIKLSSEYGLTLMGVESMEPGTLDFTKQCKSIARANPDCVYMVAVENELPLMVRQLREAGYQGYIIGEQGLGTIGFRETVGKENLEKILFAAPFAMPKQASGAGTAKLRAFFEEYIQAYGVMPTTDCACRAYDAMYLFDAAIRTAGSVEGQKVRDALSGTIDFEGLQGSYTYNGNNGEGLLSAKTFGYDGGNALSWERYLTTHPSL